MLGCALLLAGGQLVLGEPRQPLPDLPLLGTLAVLPMALATGLVRAPGAASAVCGAYLLPRALLSLFDPTIQPPPLLLVPAVAFDLAAWLRPSDLALVRRVPLGGRRVTPAVGRVTRLTNRVTPAETSRHYAAGRRRGVVGPRRCGRVRAGLAGAVFGGVLVAIEPTFAVLLGADASIWFDPSLQLASLLTPLGCALAAAAVVSGRDTAT